MNTWERFTRNQQIIDAYNTGIEVRLIAEQHNISTATVHQVVRQAKTATEVADRPRGRRPVNAERDRLIVEAYNTGRTLASIGEEHGMSRERVRQIVQRSGIKVMYTRSLTAYTQWAEQHGNTVNETFSTTRSITATIHRHPEVPAAWVRRFLRPRAHESVVGRPTTNKVWQDEDIIQALRAAAVDGVISANRYSRWRNEGHTIGDRKPPTTTLITWRFGSWANAVTKAGLQAGESWRSKYPRQWTEEDALKAVTTFVTEAHSRNLRPTYARYDAWLSANPGHPSAVYLRQITGKSWSEIVMDALRTIAA